MRNNSFINTNPKNLNLEESTKSQELKKVERKKKLPKINKSFSNSNTNNILKRNLTEKNEDEVSFSENTYTKFGKIDYGKKIKQAKEMKDLRKIYDKWLLDRINRKDEIDEDDFLMKLKERMKEEKNKYNISKTENNKSNNKKDYFLKRESIKRKIN